MTVEQKKKDLEEMLDFYSRKAALFIKGNKPLYAEIHRDRVRQIQEVLKILGYEVNKEDKELVNGIYYHTHTITAKP